jgi:hypothetical protein
MLPATAGSRPIHPGPMGRGKSIQEVRSMKRRLATLAAMSMFALALTASPVAAAGSPLTHWTIQATDLSAEGPMCGYTFTGGTLTDTYRTADVGTYPDGSPYIPAAHVTLHNVVATNAAGASFKVVGVEIYNDLKGHLTIKMMFIGKGGGIADSLNVVARYDHNGVLFVAHENDSCQTYA